MSEKLTVAELLARHGRSGSSDSSRPHRRRSLSEGGVSVAELTGSIPVVKDEHIRAAQALDRDSVNVTEPEILEAELVDAEETEAEVRTVTDADQVAAEPIDVELAGDDPIDAEVSDPEAHAEESGAAVAAAAAPAAESAAPAEKPSAEEAEADHLDEAEPTAEEARDVEEANEVETDRAEGPVEGPKEFEELVATLSDNEVVDFEDNRISWPAMIAQAIGAVAAGVLIFIGFNLLWANVSPIIVLALALIATVAMVVGVHLLLRHKDKLLMILALIVGLVLTIGPRLIIGI
ncbi:hypothetical protein F7230_05005 [Corynebacterium sp. 320]|uniref:hypothetical protein n=1 Tax=Corynebacterium TaxID=1716 RepID=UPI00125CA93B|nr:MULTISPECIES: hypothetical protein [Corynebacterium]KAB1504427.1 hypothetical protein F7230_05005 [Corynebacterium sp. 320]KAB1552474.1 hypothetical protein F7233_01595 [Corynebacterium sp. 321]KAB1554311.1 hypothetical protein F7232_05005 [Corynebacterium sp. 319]KAB3528563.1 hypothetical protein F8354_05005 [Corynebacterium sp. 250]KAB3539945.1 hypothetical protein F8390_01325 [Corynebacterium sp. 366]